MGKGSGGGGGRTAGGGGGGGLSASEVSGDVVGREANAIFDEADANDPGYAYSSNGMVMGMMSNTTAQDTGVVVRSPDGQIQAMAALSFNRRDGAVEIDYLATHPRNADRSNPNRVRGGGTQAVAQSARIAVDRGVPLRLYPLQSAIPFYERLGFQPMRNGRGDWELSGQALNNVASLARNP